MRLHASVLATALALAAAAACSNDKGTGPRPPTGPVTDLKVAANPTSIALTQDQTTTITATVQVAATSADVAGLAPSMRSTNTSVATVTTTSKTDATTGVITVTGTVKAVGGGSANIVVWAFDPNSLQVDSLLIPVTVTAKPVTSLTVTPTATTLSPTDTLTVIGLALAGTDTVFYNGSSKARPRTATFATSDTTVATVSSTGRITAVRLGTATITTTVSGVSATTTVTVIQRPVATVTVTPNPAEVRVGSTVQLTATLKGANGSTITGRPIAWASSDTTLATVDQTGKVTGVSAGGTKNGTVVITEKSAQAAGMVRPRPQAANSSAAIRNMKMITTLVEPISSRRLVQLTFFISLSVAMRKSTTFGRLTMRNVISAKAASTSMDAVMLPVRSCRKPTSGAAAALPRNPTKKRTEYILVRSSGEM
jgi:hypothetical protein